MDPLDESENSDGDDSLNPPIDDLTPTREAQDWDPETVSDWSQIPDDPNFTAEEDQTTKYALHPDDRIWRHPSELQYLAPDAESVRRSKKARGLIGLSLTSAVIGAAVASLLVVSLLRPAPQIVERVVEREITTANISNTDLGLQRSMGVPDIAAQVTPSVVRVEVLRNGRVSGTGSGVIFRDDGHLITNAHVVNYETDFRVVLASGNTFRASLVGLDRRTDIAVLRPDQKMSNLFSPATLGSTDNLRAGEIAIAIGSPLSLRGGPTVTVGVISATNRRLQSPQGDWLYELVQTDAPISPGSSGGALVDRSGAVVGITTVIAVTDVGAEGLGFATPIEIARDVAADIIQWGRARHGRLGISGLDATANLLPPSHAAGVYVQSVDPQGPSAPGGLQIGDVVVELNGRPVPDMGALVVSARMLEPGSSALLRIWRDGQLMTLEIDVAELD